ncbi:MAG: folate family ECF transporter S component [Erysipelotrichaceae bacterium]|nr:folate family ECF transporter S component [Erysipelotrichaceae bacterium]
MFRKSAALLKQTRYLALLAIFIALKIALSSIRIPVADNLFIYVTFFIKAVEGAIFGPAGCLLSGFISDILGFMIHPTGPFFIGYTISSMVGCFIWGLFLYDRKITILNIILAKTLINYGVNVILGSLWASMMYSKGFMYYMSTSLIKNSILLPIEIIAVVIVMNLLIPFLSRKRWITSQTIPIPFR